MTKIIYQHIDSNFTDDIIKIASNRIKDECETGLRADVFMNIHPTWERSGVSRCLETENLAVIRYFLKRYKFPEELTLKQQIALYFLEFERLHNGGI